MIGQIYTTLQHFITERIPEIKYVTLYNNQFNQHLENRALPLPGILIEILPINFDDMLNNVQYAKVDVNIHFGTEIYNGFDRDDAMQDTSFEHLELLDKLYIGLNRVNSEDLPDEMKNELYIQGGFRRNSVTVNQYNSVIHHSVINGSFMLFDLSAVKKYTEVELKDVDLKVNYIPSPPFIPEVKEINIK